MKNSLSTTILWLSCLCFLLSVTLSSAQAQKDDEPIFSVVEYMKTVPGKNADYLKVEEIWKKVHQARVESGKLRSWALYRVVMPAGTSTEYNYLTVNSYIGSKALADHFEGSWWEELGGWKVLTEEEQKIAQSAPTTRHLVRTDVFQRRNMVMAEGDNFNPKYLVVNYMRVKDGMMSEYARMEDEVYKPLHKAGIDAGIREGWVLHSHQMPYSADKPYHAVTVDIYDSFEEFSSPPPEGFFEKVHPGKDPDKMYEEMMKTRDLIRAELLAPVMFTESQ